MQRVFFMSLLTINIFLESREEFFENNQEALDRAKGIEELEIHLGEKGECYEQYCSFLNNTMSKYVIFYNEKNILGLDRIKEALRVLNNTDEDILSQKVMKENSEADMYKTGGMNPNPFYFGRYIFKTETLKKIVIEEKEIPFFTDKIVLALTREKEQIPVVKAMENYTEEGLEKQARYYLKPYDENWYIPYFRDFALPCARKGELTPTEQRLFVHMILRRFYMNQNERNKFVLSDEQVDVFFDQVRELTRYIDDVYLIETRKRQGFVKFFAYLLLKEKYGKEPEFEVRTGSADSKKLEYLFGENIYDVDCLKARIKAINYKEEHLVIDGEIIADYCLDHIEEDFEVLVNGEKCEWVNTELYNLDAFFGRTVHRYTAFQFEIAKKDLDKKTGIQFKGHLKGKEITIPLQFHRKVSARLERSHWSYWTFEDKIITFSSETIWIDDLVPKKKFILETGLIAKMLFKEKSSKRIEAVCLRLLYWISRKHYRKKENWVFFDKLYKAGDNGEYLFSYCARNCPDVNSYYIVTKESLDYKRLKKKYRRHILVFGSLRQKLVLLNTQIVFATHAGVWPYCGFKGLQRFLKNLLNAEIVCIQHGLTIQNIAQYQNRLKDNTHMYFCASKYEIAGLNRKVYGYQKGELRLTGCPRYDGLKNNDQKQILIAPTWRRNIVITGNAFGTSKEYNPEFKHTKYFEIYNRLINDQRLLAAAEQNGYKIVFLIHPTLSSQVDDYDKNDYTSIIPAVSEVSYEKMLTESSLMVTDYSGIQFDFAYMKKPILYYHPNELPPQYEEGIYKYDTMGFGPIVEEYDRLIESLCEMIKNGCIMERKYLDRVEDFFQYTDHSNCERIVKEIRDWKGYQR